MIYKEEIMHFINDILAEADNYGVLVEVVCDALKNLKENPKLTIQQALQYSLNEWVK